MAKRKCFLAQPDQIPVYREELFEFAFFNGFALVQKQKSIFSFHQAIRKAYPEKHILEISTKSPDPLGVSLSAFNLKLACPGLPYNYHLENVFQASKVFKEGGPYRDILSLLPREAKRDERTKTSGPLLHFDFFGEIFPLEPKSLFYDWIYLKALAGHPELAHEIIRYDAFTDIEFNHIKSFSCQARSAAIFVSLHRRDELGIALENKDFLRKFYKEKNDTLICPLC